MIKYERAKEKNKQFKMTNHDAKNDPTEKVRKIGFDFPEIPEIHSWSRFDRFDPEVCSE